MNMRGVVFALSMLVLLPASVRADQARDWLLNGVPAGNFAILDYLGAGAQLSLERRQSFLGGANMFTLNGSTLIGQYSAQAQATASLRVLIFELSGTIGYRALWRNLAYDRGDNGAYCKECDRPARRDSDPIFDPTSGHAKYPYAEAGIGLFLPLNDWMVFGSQFLAHWEDSPDRSFDQIYTYLHDGGLMYLSETTLMFKHRKWGGIGPYLQVASLPRDNRHELQVAAGFNALSRVGLIARNDALMLSVLARPGDGSYGNHWYYMPARVIIAYRMSFAL